MVLYHFTTDFVILKIKCSLQVSILTQPKLGFLITVAAPQTFEVVTAQSLRHSYQHSQHSLARQIAYSLYRASGPCTLGCKDVYGGFCFVKANQVRKRTLVLDLQKVKGDNRKHKLDREMTQRLQKDVELGFVMTAKL